MTYVNMVNPELARRYMAAGLWTDKTFFELIEERAKAHPDREVFADARRRITYGALEDEILRCAEFYRRIGVKRGDVVTVQLPNRIEFAVAFFALGADRRDRQQDQPRFPCARARLHPQILRQQRLCLPAGIPQLRLSGDGKELRDSVPDLARLIVAGKAAEGARSLDELRACPPLAARASRSHGPQRGLSHGLHLGHDRRSEVRAAQLQHHALCTPDLEPRHGGDRARRAAGLPAGRSQLGLHHAHANHHGRRARRADGALSPREARWS